MDKIQKDRTYEYILDHYNSIKINGEEKLRNRFLFLIDAVMIWIELCNLDEYIGFNTKVLEDITIDYFADIVRLKEFHKLDITNDIKVAAYTAYWVNERKPLFYKIEPDAEILENNPQLNYVNEWFCLDLMVNMIYDSSKQLQGLPGECEMYNDMLDALHYDFVYRDISAQSLELALLSLEASSSQPRLNDSGSGD